MRTTLTLDDDILKEATRRAKELKIPIGKTISDLARRGLQAVPPLKRANGLVMFNPPDGSPRITMRKVREALSDFP